jgi:hypothetical protein
VILLADLENVEEIATHRVVTDKEMRRDVRPKIKLSFKTGHSGQFIVFQTALGPALLSFAGSAFQQ